MRTARSIPTTRQVAHGALLSLALLAAVGSAATAAPAVSPLGLSRAALQALDVEATTPVAIGAAVSATANLSDVEEADTGTITLSLYGPGDTDCTSDPVFVTVPPLATEGPGPYGPVQFTPDTAGTYQWVAEYVGTNEETAETTCGQDPVVVNRAEPTLTTVASGDIPLGDESTDQATLTGAFQPTGTITFNLYGPGDVVCEEAPVETSSVTLTPGQTVATSAPFEPLVAGDYRWRAAYSGDVNNLPAGTGCADEPEQFTVLTVTRLTTAVADPAVELGTAVSDTATLTGATEDAGGTITFSLYGPNDGDCTQDAVFTSDPVTVSGNGDYSSGPFTPDVVGTYRWIASYTGDADNTGFTTQCNDPNETVVVNGDLVTPVLATEASRDTFVGKRVFDEAFLTGGNDPTGTITFSLYGPNDATCARTPVFTSVVDVDGNTPVGGPGYLSGSFRPHVPGTYQWVAEYSGDENNEAVRTRCGDPAEQVVVRKKKPYGGSPRP